MAILSMVQAVSCRRSDQQVATKQSSRSMKELYPWRAWGVCHYILVILVVDCAEAPKGGRGDSASSRTAGMAALRRGFGWKHTVEARSASNKNGK
jgi:hypothetical protein